MADTLSAGGNGVDGQLTILAADGQPMVHVQAPTTNPLRKDAELALGGSGRNGVLRIRRAKDARQTTIGDSGMSLYGHLSMHTSDNRNPLNMGPSGNDTFRVLLGDTGVAPHVQLSNGNNGPGPLIELDGKANALRFGNPGSSTTSTVEIIGQQGVARFGGENVSGSVVIQDGDAKPRVTLRASDASVRVGGSGANGTVSVMGSDGQPLLELLGRSNECVLGLGQANRPARISLYGADRREAIKLDAASGDIMLANADCAEMFDVEADAVPGSVMVLTADGVLAPSEKPYDMRVAGVVSGAGAFQPGLILDRRETGRTRAPIALMGKVYCLVDATDQPVEVGDLLTTGETPGHAMRLVERERALGAVLGKALAPLHRGHGLIPILVTLQ